ncbi:hypothetical protein H257_09412 [Aphanomyces astaci]|uniref:Uncharacterized protein n=1 Tax=Aphanomyces astaci TaxID=112090 RepID=W4GBN5_APHAT|nr:hypothetical protein H257_09412 [Aphanomyces astaci]ETV76378.1 hypothetical protein H257_09412 [Aphanomyces astaci]|eukprot:XP_009833923.1 hypothetical protein H257_09412 [Aphanomyces astaci]
MVRNVAAKRRGWGAGFACCFSYMATTLQIAVVFLALFLELFDALLEPLHVLVGIDIGPRAGKVDIRGEIALTGLGLDTNQKRQAENENLQHAAASCAGMTTISE